VGRAWLFRKPANEVEPEYEACLATWLVNRPGLNVDWAWWLVAVIHLRDVPGAEPAFLAYPQAEYEFMIYAIDPEQCPNPEPDAEIGYPILTPYEVVEQFHEVTDTDASRLCELGVRTILSGGLDPVEDHQAYWNQLIVKNVAEFRDGKNRTN